jgi:hypothetical protein
MLLNIYIIDNNIIVDMIIKHLRKLRSIAQYANAVMFVYIEANLSWVTANTLAGVAQAGEFYPCIVKKYDPKNKGRFGVWTQEAEKEKMCHETKHVMADGALYYAEHFFSETAPLTIQQEIKAQLEVYRRNIRLSDSGKVTIEYTGKSTNRKDDLAIVIQLLLYWSRYNRESTEYQQEKQSNSWRE